MHLLHCLLKSIYCEIDYYSLFRSQGNEIIQKLQIDVRNIKSKVQCACTVAARDRTYGLYLFWHFVSWFIPPLQLKLRNMVTTQQERVIGEREGALDKLRLELEAVKVAMARKDEEVCLSGVIVE